MPDESVEKERQSKRPSESKQPEPERDAVPEPDEATVAAQVWQRPDGSRYILEATFDRKSGAYTGHPDTEGPDDVNVTVPPEARAVVGGSL